MGTTSGLKHLNLGELGEYPRGSFLNRHLGLNSACSDVPLDISVQHPFQMREGIQDICVGWQM